MVVNVEIYLFILWEKARVMEKAILDDIRENFNILQIMGIQWSKETFSDNLTKFYGVKLPPGSHKEMEVGTGEFLLVMIEDKNPLYVPRRTNSGDMNVNVNVFDSKEMYRKWTGGHKIHSSNDDEETDHDLFLLTGRHLQDAVDIYKSGGLIPDYKDPI